MQRFQDEIDIVFSFLKRSTSRTCQEVSKSRQKWQKSCRNTFTTPQTLLSVGFFFPAVLPSQTLLEVPLSPPLSNIINPSNVSLFFTKSKGTPTKKMRCNSFSRNKRICFSLSFAVSLVCMTNVFRFHFVQAVLSDFTTICF